MYSTASMLRTMELILGLKPMSQFDAAATTDVQLIPGHARPAALRGTAGERGPGGAEHCAGLGRPDQDELHPGGRGK